jgi:hypothetical protein
MIVVNLTNNVNHIAWKYYLKKLSDNFGIFIPILEIELFFNGLPYNIIAGITFGVESAAPVAGYHSFVLNGT